MKRIYSKPETEIIDMEPVRIMCASGGEPVAPENEEWFDTDDTGGMTKFNGVLD